MPPAAAQVKMAQIRVRCPEMPEVTEKVRIVFLQRAILPALIFADMGEEVVTQQALAKRRIEFRFTVKLGNVLGERLGRSVVTPVVEPRSPRLLGGRSTSHL